MDLQDIDGGVKDDDNKPYSFIIRRGLPDQYVCRFATHVAPVCNMPTLSDTFLSNVPQVTTVDLSAVSSVRSIGPAFLQFCSGLREFDLNPLRGKLEGGMVPECFMMYCSRLKVIDLSQLGDITGISTKFLLWCSSLASLDLAPLVKLTEIPSLFLSNCNGLKSLDLSAKLKSLDLAPLRNVVKIGSFFFRILQWPGGVRPRTAVSTYRDPS